MPSLQRRRSVTAAYTIGAILLLVGWVGILGQAACAKAPPNLSPVGVRAFQATRVVHVLDMVRDTAIAAEAAQPQMLSTSTTRAIVEWHRAAVAAAGATPTGWGATALAGLDGVDKNLSAAERQVIGPYFALARSLLKEVG